MNGTYCTVEESYWSHRGFKTGIKFFSILCFPHYNAGGGMEAMYKQIHNLQQKLLIPTKKYEQNWQFLLFHMQLLVQVCLIQSCENSQGTTFNTTVGSMFSISTLLKTVEKDYLLHYWHFTRWANGTVLFLWKMSNSEAPNLDNHFNQNGRMHCVFHNIQYYSDSIQ